MSVKERVARLRERLLQENPEEDSFSERTVDWGKFNQTPLFPNFSKWSKLQ